MENYEICHCMGVSFADVEDAMHDMTSFSDVLSVFQHVQEVTHCSTGCGGCHDKILDAISEIMHSYLSKNKNSFEKCLNSRSCFFVIIIFSQNHLHRACISDTQNHQAMYLLHKHNRKSCIYSLSSGFLFLQALA